MRGPGPAWRAKHGLVAPAFDLTSRYLSPRFCALRRFFSAALFGRPACALAIARDHGAFPDGAFPRRHPPMNGPSHDAAALCNSRRLSQSGPRRWRTGRRSADRVDVTVFNQPFRLAGGRRQRAEGFRDHLRDARAHAVSPRAVRGAAQAEAADHLGHAQCRDRHGGREGPQASCCAGRNGAAIPPRR